LGKNKLENCFCKGELGGHPILLSVWAKNKNFKPFFVEENLMTTPFSCSYRPQPPDSLFFLRKIELGNHLIWVKARIGGLFG